MHSSPRLLVLVGAALLWTACASVKPPAVRVAGVHLDGVSLTGARVDVGLQIRNVNPEDLHIERFDYEVKLNGQVLGHGYSADPLMLAGFKEDKVVSRVDVNLLKVPGVVKTVAGYTGGTVANPASGNANAPAGTAMST